MASHNVGEKQEMPRVPLTPLKYFDHPSTVNCRRLYHLCYDMLPGRVHVLFPPSFPGYAMQC